MCELVKELKELADKVIKLNHEELDKIFTYEDDVEFVNSVRTLQEHSNHIVKNHVA